jgi:hypothetical protein
VRTQSKVIFVAVSVSVLGCGIALGIQRNWFGTLLDYLLGITGNGPIVEKSISISSPDANWQATIERVDNGMGFGMGLEYNEVHIHSPGSSIVVHGDNSPSGVFYVESEGTEYDFPTLQWIDPNHILIEYPDLHKPGEAMSQFHGMTIEYRTR